tara:strand:- start:318 stop:599 length:282 start_codon:yes stop_codon:yes gene_type:complete
MESNRLIAEFMGLKKYGYKDENYLVLNNHLSPEQMPYHTSWDWLMPVSQKIEALLSDSIGTIGYFDECLTSNDLEIRYQAVVDFIEYQNKKKL